MNCEGSNSSGEVAQQGRQDSAPYQKCSRQAQRSEKGTSCGLISLPQELKTKICEAIPLSVPRPKGEIVFVSDGSSVGGDGTLLHIPQTDTTQESNARILVSWIVKHDKACPTPIGAFLRHKGQGRHFLVPARRLDSASGSVAQPEACSK